jgi:hypothetical protein
MLDKGLNLRGKKSGNDKPKRNKGKRRGRKWRVL